MADLLLSSIDLASVRFQTSYAQEITLSVRVLQHDPTGLHRAWARTTRERLAARPDLDLAVLAALVPANGFLADILTPTLGVQPRDVADELGAVAALDPGWCGSSPRWTPTGRWRSPTTGTPSAGSSTPTSPSARGASGATASGRCCTISAPGST